MKKVFFYFLAILFVTSCSKSETPSVGSMNEMQKDVEYDATIDIVYDSCRDLFISENIDTNIWRWMRYEHDTFTFDIDCVLDFQPSEFSCRYISSTSAIVSFSDGTEIELNDIMYDNTTGTTSFVSVVDEDYESYYEINSIFYVNMVDGMVLCSQSKSVEIGGLRKLAEKIVGFLKGELSRRAECKKRVAEKACECANRSDCFPTMSSSTCVICGRNPLNGSSYDCSQHTLCCS